MDLFFKALLLFGFCCLCHGTLYDYYWRDYKGDIPEDAVDGGWDKNNSRTYIGQATIKNYGVIPVNIYPGDPYVIANIQGLRRVNTFVQILSSQTRRKFRWIPVTTENFHEKTANSFVVPGGVEWGIVTNIGRISYQGELKVAKVFTNDKGEAYLYFPGEEREIKALSYEVLVIVEDDETVFDSA